MEESLTNSDAEYAFEIVKAICEEVGPGVPGSPQERERAGIIKKELEKHLGAGNVAVEEFSFAPEALTTLMPVGGLCLLIAAALNISAGRVTGALAWVLTIAGVVFSFIPIVFYALEYLFCIELVDPLFKKKQSVNVIGTFRKPGTKDVKRVLILSGHHDSAPENTWLRLTGYGFLFLSMTFAVGVIFLPAASLFQLAGKISGNAELFHFGTLGWILLAYPIVPAVLFCLFFFRGKKNGGVVPGAADNLSGSALAVTMCRFLVNNPATIPDNTEIRFISFGAEEAILRGSARYVARHLAELKALDARLLNYETVAHPEINILNSDMNGTMKNSPEMIKSVAAAAERARVPHKIMPAGIGMGSDAGPFSKAGLKAATLLPFKMPQQMVAFYHQKWDAPEVLSMEPLLNVLKLTFEWVRCGGEPA